MGSTRAPVRAATEIRRRLVSIALPSHICGRPRRRGRSSRRSRRLHVRRLKRRGSGLLRHRRRGDGRGCRDRRRGRRRSGLRGWGGRRRGCRRRVGGNPRRKQGQWIDVRVVVSDAHTEMDVRHIVLRLSGWARLGDWITLPDVPTTLHQQRSEMRQRCLVATARSDSDGQPVCGHLPGEGHLAAHGSQHRTRIAQRDVHTTVLPGRIAVGGDRELTENGSVRGPCPRPRGWSDDERRHDHADANERPFRCPKSEHEPTVAPKSSGSNAIDGFVTECRDRERSWMRP